MTPKQAIDHFLAQKRIAIAGVSRTEHDFSRGLLREMRLRGYDTVPVNPHAEEIEGLTCFASVRAILPPPDGVIVMVPATQVESVVRECAEAGIKRVWLHGPGTGSAPSDTLCALCEQGDITLISGHCPYMFLTDTSWIHRLHARILKWLRKYPR